MDHLQHFGLRIDPFSCDPLPELQVEIPEQAAAVHRLSAAIALGRRLCVLVGDPGSGKTTVARALLDALDEDRFEASLVVVMPGSEEPERLLARIARQSGVAEPAAERAELLGQLHAALVAQRDEGRSPVVILDEAQLLIRRDTLEMLRGLLNFEYEDRYLLTLVLVGQSELARALVAAPALGARVDVVTRLRGLADDARSYLERRLKAAGADAGLLPAETRDALHAHSGGLLRRLHALGEGALYVTFQDGARVVEPEHVERAAKSLDLTALAGGSSGVARGVDGLPLSGPPKDDDELEGLLGDPLDER